MRRRNVLLCLFVCLALIQIGAPLYMIGRREMTLRHGRQYRFLTAPVDPYDAFRGRYVALRIEPNSVVVSGEMRFFPGQKVFALIDEDEKGFAKINGLSAVRPDVDTYLAVRVRYMSGNRAYLKLPFDRYYMTEKKAPAAEIAYLQHSRRDKQDAYITVRVSSGFAVLEELYIGGMPVSDFLAKAEDKTEE